MDIAASLEARPKPSVAGLRPAPKHGFAGRQTPSRKHPCRVLDAATPRSCLESVLCRVQPPQRVIVRRTDRGPKDRDGTPPVVYPLHSGTGGRALRLGSSSNRRPDRVVDDRVSSPPISRTPRTWRTW